MAVDRSYLPWKAAREYQDRGMKKWQGFFISEHTSILNEMYDPTNEEFKRMKPIEILMFLNQAQLNRVQVSIRIAISEYKSDWVDGYVDLLDEERVSIKFENDYRWIEIQNIISVESFDYF